MRSSEFEARDVWRVSVTPNCHGIARHWKIVLKLLKIMMKCNTGNHFCCLFAFENNVNHSLITTSDGTMGAASTSIELLISDDFVLSRP